MKLMNLLRTAQRCLRKVHYWHFAYSSEKNHIFKLTLMGMMAQKTSNHRMTLIAHLKRLISLLCFSSNSVGKTFVQN